MKIIVDITPLRGQKSGIGNYLYYTLKYLIKNVRDIDLIGFSLGIRKFSDDSLDLLKKFRKSIIIPFPTSPLYYYWNFVSFPKVDFILPSAEVYHATNYYLPPTSKKCVLSIYDLSFLKSPALANQKIVSLFSKKIKKHAHIANHIITCSEYSKQEITTLLNIPPEKISVAYPAVDKTIFYLAEKHKSFEKLWEKYRIPTPYVLFVGTIEERKNVDGLLDIFRTISTKLPHYLLIIGKKGSSFNKVYEKIKTLKNPDKVIIVDYIEKHSDLRLFYNCADLFIFPSIDEGFGIPVLEAMACGCPVLSSNKGALPEVIGKGGITHDPLDIEGFANKALQVLCDVSEKERIIQYGFQQVEKFSWENTAKKHYEIYKKVATND
ncbi:MAG: glycosyltransferase family 4 protein [Candidatus Hydrogenedentes bacterium]|nr:glycosyltransferase family 4 protein [Candidatus Hydrogenedentota bacterium]